jgi:hypothetical protein
VGEAWFCYQKMINLFKNSQIMKASLIDILSGKNRVANIKRIRSAEAPLKKDGWKFNWRELAKTEGAICFNVALPESPGRAEGVILLSVYFEEMAYMNNLEVAPWNRGEEKRLDNVAGCLLAFACRFSFVFGKGHYQGYLSFNSKSQLISHYQKKYGATSSGGTKMFIDPLQGQRLIKQYLIQP